jgi:hypothetical protein
MIVLRVYCFRIEITPLNYDLEQLIEDLMHRESASTLELNALGPTLFEISKLSGVIH